MSHMKWNFYKIIELILKKKWSVIDSEFLKDIVKKIMCDEFSDKRYYKIIHHLKNKWFIYSLRKGLYFVSTPEKKHTEAVLLEENYRSILHKKLHTQFQKNRYIWWSKALELNIWNNEIPWDILIINKKKQSFDILMLDQKVQYKKYTSWGKDLFSKYKKRTKKKKFWRYSFSYACLELALLEALYSIDEIRDAYQIEYVKRILKKTKQLDLDLMTDIIRTGKHHTSINRLHQIAKKINPKISVKIYECIKKNSFVISI